MSKQATAAQLNKLKGAVTKAEAKVAAAKEALEAANAAVEAAKAEGKGVEEAEAAAMAAMEAVEVAEAELATAEAALKAEAGEASGTGMVPVLTFDGEPIPVNSEIRLLTAGNGMCLTDNDGNRVTDSSPVKLNGGDVRDGDWYTTQFKAGLLVVDSIRALK